MADEFKPEITDERKPLTLLRLKEMFTYDQNTGVFTRKIMIGRMSPGTIAGSKCHRKKRAYIRICVNRKFYYLHQLAWFYCHGKWSKMIDHLDGDGTNNKLENLRSCTYSENMGNSKVYSTNKSGFKGVHWHKLKNKWGSQIVIASKNINLGYFINKEDAYAEYCKASVKYRGKFSRVL
jgi:hypothetical protein